MKRYHDSLSVRERDILIFIEKFIYSNDYSPSHRDIGKGVGISSTSLVDYYLKNLENKGWIASDSNVSRSIRLLRSPMTPNKNIKPAIINIPILGRIMASVPIPMPQSDFFGFDCESFITINSDLIPRNLNTSDFFALEVEGNSMMDAMVVDGDIVIMVKATQAKNGEMAVVWLEDRHETTLKYVYYELEQVRLQSVNPTMEPVIINNPAQLRIMGIVVMLIRGVSVRSGNSKNVIENIDINW